MKTLLNILWFVFGGLIMALGYFLVGVVLCVLILTIPFGVQAFKMGRYTLWPYGRTVVAKEGSGTASTIVNVLWIVLAGVWLAIGHIVTGVALCLTIVGIPFGIVHFKLSRLILAPFGNEVVTNDVAEARGAQKLL